MWGYMKVMIYACKVNMRDKLLQQILYAARQINYAAVLHTDRSSLVTHVRICIQVDAGHFEQLA
jgi:hypothetical protein